MLCPRCKKEQMQYFPWLGQMWKCSCGYMGPVAIEITGKAVLEFLRKVPKGKVVTYKFLGEKFDMHARTISKIMAGNKRPDKYPCYKVINSDGTLGGYSGKGKTRGKAKLLKQDGIKIKKGKIDLEQFGLKN
jgi:methylated-DNA-[protein]-cysteine S-methyltransferase